MAKWSVLFLSLVCAASGAFAQVAEFSVSGGVSRFGSTSLGTLGSDLTSGNINLTDGFRLAFRFTVNTKEHFGHEFGYAYNRSHLRFNNDPTQDMPMPVHQGFYDFLVYATNTEARVRPFVTGGVQFSSFFPPGSSVYYGNQVTKFGINYGGGIKAKVKGPWGVRLDLRQYNTGKPDFGFYNTSGRLMQTEISAGVFYGF